MIHYHREGKSQLIGVIMINFMRGAIRDYSSQGITVEVNGLGWLVQAPQKHVFEVGKEVELYIYMHWNQENGPQLFGFRTMVERQVFMLVLACSGLGPKIGCALLTHLSPYTIVSSLAYGDTKTLSSVSGIGQKKAEAMVLQLREKAEKMLKEENFGSEQRENQSNHLVNASQALGALGYSRIEVVQALEYVKKQSEASSDQSFDYIMRRALGYLSKVS